VSAPAPTSSPPAARPRPARRAARRLLLALAVLLPGALIANELLFVFPFTSLWLDVRGDARLPPAGPGQVRVLAVGDILLGDAAEATLARQGFDHVFAATRPLISGADLALGNLEGPISASAEPADSGKWVYRMHPEAASALARAGFDVLVLANNHVRDCGDQGVLDTVAALERRGLAHVGAGATPAEAARPVRRQVGGVRLAILAYHTTLLILDTPVPQDHLEAVPGRPGVALARPEQLARDLPAARAGSDLVVVSIHLGDRYQEGPLDFEREICRRAIDAGADVVVGHGPHVMGPVELYRGRPILYSVGNFGFGSGNIRARFSLIALLTLEAAPRPRLARVELLPIFTVNRAPAVGFRTKLVTGWQARRALATLRDRSPGARLELAGAPARAVLTLDR